jgi:hypothetical protein
VTRGDEQLVSGMNYVLIVEAVNGTGNTASYLAEVYDRPWTKTRELKYFKPATKCRSPLDLCSYR